VKQNGTATALLFGSGKVVFTGVDSEEKMQELVTSVWKRVVACSEGVNVVQERPNYGG